MPLGLLLTHPSTNPSMFETELQHNYIDLKEQLNVTAAVALANTQRPPTLHVNSVVIPFHQLHTALIFDKQNCISLSMCVGCLSVCFLF